MWLQQILLLASLTVLPPGVKTVSTEAELVEALTCGNDVTILVKKLVPITKQITVETPTVIRLIGVTTDAGFTSDMKFNGSYTNIQNGLYFGNRQTIVLNLTLTNYDGGGAFVKLACTESSVLSGCKFDRVGTGIVPPATQPTNSSADCWSSTAVLAVGATNIVMMNNNTFTNSAKGNYAHCIYISGVRSSFLDNNRYRWCGQSVQVMGGGKVTTVINSMLSEPSKIPSYRAVPTKWIYPMIATLPGNSVWMFNKWSGTESVMYIEFPGISSLVDYNDYTKSLRTSEWPKWCFVGAQEPYLDWWIGQGMDVHSLWPSVYADFERCYSGPNIPFKEMQAPNWDACSIHDCDSDRDIDMDDFGATQRMLDNH